MIRSTPALLVAISLFVACGSASPAGSKVKQPFSGSTYESNNRFFRGTGQGVSAKQNIARGKAAGFSDYQVKLDRDRLVSRVREYLADPAMADTHGE